MIQIIGAGIAGLTAAIALEQAGFSVRVHERAATLEPVGAGLMLQTNASAVLQALGVDLSDSVPIGRFELRSGDRLLGRNPAGPPEAPGIAMHRAELQDALLDRLRSPLILGDEVTEPDPDAALVVAADGISSRQRLALFGEQPLRDAGQTCWRFVCEHPSPVGMEVWLPQGRYGRVALSRGRTYVFIVESGHHTDPDLSRFRDWHPDLAALIDAPLISSHVAALQDQPKPSFGRGKVVLIGDAAHAMTPNMGQGAGSGIEDAAALAILAREGLDGLPERLQRLRGRRVEGLHSMSWRIGKVAHVRGLRGLRDGLMALGGGAVERQATQMWQPGLALAAQLRELSA